MGRKTKYALESEYYENDLYDRTEVSEEPPAYSADHTSNWQALARAIVIYAAKDYESKYSAYWSSTHYIQEDGTICCTDKDRKTSSGQTVERAKKWFSSQWCEMLLYFGTDGSEMSGAYIPRGIENMIDKRKKAAMRKKHQDRLRRQKAGMDKVPMEPEKELPEKHVVKIESARALIKPSKIKKESPLSGMSDEELRKIESAAGIREKERLQARKLLRLRSRNKESVMEEVLS